MSRMSREGNKPYTYAHISLNFSRFQAALNRAAGAVRYTMAAAYSHRYWTDHTGRVRRMTGKRPLLHKGGKP